MKTFAALLVGIGVGAGAMLAAQTTAKGGFIVQRDAEIAKNEPGTPQRRRPDRSATRSSTRRRG
jgi:hypothetical protein